MDGRKLPDGWRDWRGYNGAFDQAVLALRYVAKYGSPAQGGEMEFNSQHILQIAQEVAKSMKDLCDPALLFKSYSNENEFAKPSEAIAHVLSVSRKDEASFSESNADNKNDALFQKWLSDAESRGNLFSPTNKAYIRVGWEAAIASKNQS